MKQIDLSDLEIKEKIFESKTIIIYRSFDNKSKNHYILKVLKSEMNEKVLTQFEFEYHILKKIAENADRPTHIINVVDKVNFNGNKTIILEDIGGFDLTEYSKGKSTLGAEQFYLVATSIVKGLIDIHRCGIIHKDINPRNVIFNKVTGNLKIIDFGISSELSKEKKQVSVSDKVVGSLPYISPEQSGRIDVDLDYRTDYYSLGMTLFELWSGEYALKGGSLIEWLHAHIAQDPDFSPLENKNAPKFLIKIIKKLIEKDPDKRYQSSLGILRDLLVAQENFEKGIDPDIDVGKFDTSNRFQIPQKLFGRDTELHTLLEELSKIKNGESRFVGISGEAGVGKTRLIGEIKQYTIKESSTFISGKYEQYQASIIPYLGLSQALNDLIKQIQILKIDEIEKWKKDVLDHVGNNIKILVDLIPNLKEIVGDVPNVDQLNLSESENRFKSTVLSFLSFVATPERPLVLFLDDLQWADSSTFLLIKEIFEKHVENILIFGSYRNEANNEKSELQNLTQYVETNRLGKNIQLSPLNLDAVEMFVGALLKKSPSKVNDLSVIMAQKTNGNPYFMTDLVTKYYRDGLIYFKEEKGEWNYDLAQIKLTKIADNVVDFMIEKLNHFSSAAKNILAAASCIGFEFDLNDLSNITNLSHYEILNQLWPIVLEGPIVPLDSNYKQIHLQSGLAQTKINARFKFQHDQVLSACTRFVSEDKLNEFHYLFVKNLSKEIDVHISKAVRNLKNVDENFLAKYPDLNRVLIDVVFHAEKGISNIKEYEEIKKFIFLFYVAAKKIKLSMSYDRSTQLLESALILTKRSIEIQNENYEAEIKLELFSNKFLMGKPVEGEKIFQEALVTISDPVRKAECYHYYTLHLSQKGDYEKVIDTSIMVLKDLNFNVKKNPSIFIILKKVLSIHLFLKDKSFNDLVALPEIRDERYKVILKFLDLLGNAAYLIGHKNLVGISSFDRVLVNFKQGIDSGSNFSISMTGFYIVKGLITGKMQELEKLFQLGVEINKQLDDPTAKSRFYSTVAIIIAHWSHGFSYINNLYETAIKIAKENGDVFYYTACLSFYFKLRIEENLKKYIHEGESVIHAAQITHSKDTSLMAKVCYNFSLALAGRKKLKNSMFVDDKPDIQTEKLFDEQNFETGLCIFYYYKLRLCLMSESHERGLYFILKTEKHYESILGTIFQWEIPVYSIFLIHRILNSGRKISFLKRRFLKKRYFKYRNLVARWSKNGNTRFDHFAKLFKAMELDEKGKKFEALKHFEEAIKLASDENPQIRANFFETYGDFLIRNGLKEKGEDNLVFAYTAYSIWGGVHKVKKLKEKIGNLGALHKIQEGMGLPTLIASDIVKAPSTKNNYGTTIDSISLDQLSKMAMTISKEVVPEKLFHRVITILLELAGADNVHLFLGNSKENLIQVAQGDHTEEMIKIDKIPFRNIRSIITSIVENVLLNPVPITIGNASNDEFYRDLDVVKERRIKSVLCMPIINMGKQLGILYLENSKIGNVFTKSNLEILSILAGQASIAIENSDLYNKLEQKVIERTRELEEAQKGLIQAAHYSGMAEVASEVLHNIGNTLTVVGGTIENMQNYMGSSKLEVIEKIAGFFDEKNDNFNEIMSNSEIRSKVANFLTTLPKLYVEERSIILDGIVKLKRSVNTIQEIIMLQDKHAHSTGLEEPIEMVKIVEEVCMVYKSVLVSQNISIEFRGERQFSVIGQRTQLFQIVTNLVKNAIESITSSVNPGKISFEFSKLPDGKLLFEITDSGQGIEEEIIPKIFNFGFSTKKNGSGFGLHTTANYLAKMNAKIEVKSGGLGKGATFLIYFMNL